MSIDVTCLCAYHGRNWLLMDSVESFRRQRTTGFTAELMILNDCTDQVLTCSESGVRVINLPDQCRTLSEKWNIGVEMARGTWIAAWDDDDISLPLRLSSSVQAIGKANLYSNLWAWSMCHQRGVIDQIGKTWLCSSLFRRDAFMRSGGCDPDDWNDRVTFAKLKQGAVVQNEPEHSKIHYIYRWAGELHDSGNASLPADERVKRFHHAVVSDKRFVSGEHQVVPWWSMDYEGSVADAIRRKVKVSN